MPRIQWKKLLWLLPFLTGIYLRLYGLDSKPIHEDESWTLSHITHFSLPELFDNKAYELLTPPAFFVLTKAATLMMGVSEFSLRFCSAFFSALSILLVYRIGREWVSREMGWMAAALLACSPLSILYAQTARSYALFGFLALLSFIFVFKYFQTKKFVFWLGFFLTVFLGLATNFLFIALLGAATFCFFFVVKKTGKREIFQWIMACFLLGVVFWRPYAAAMHQYQFETEQNPLPFWVRSVFGFFGLTLGESVYPFNFFIVLPAAGLFGLAFILGIYVFWKHREGGGWFVLSCLVFPFALWLYLKVDTLRHLSHAVPFYLLWITLGVASLRRPWKYALLILLLLPQAVSAYYWHTANHGQVLNANLIIPWREVANDVERLKKEATVVVHPNRQFDSYQHYMQGDLSRYLVLSEEGYSEKLRSFLKKKPDFFGLLLLPNSTRDKRIDTIRFSCYQIVFQKGYVFNPVLREHFQAGKKIFGYAVRLEFLQRKPGCQEEEWRMF